MRELYVRNVPGQLQGQLLDMKISAQSAASWAEHQANSLPSQLDSAAQLLDTKNVAIAQNCRVSASIVAVDSASTLEACLAPCWLPADQKTVQSLGWSRAAFGVHVDKNPSLVFTRGKRVTELFVP